MIDPTAKALGIAPLAKYQDSDLPAIVAEPNLPEVITTSLSDEIIPEHPTDQELDSDFEFARQKVKNALVAAEKALNAVLQVAEASEHPRAYEVVGGLIKTISDSSEKLLSLSKVKRDMSPKPIETPNTAPTNITNNNLIMTTADILKMLKEGTR